VTNEEARQEVAKLVAKYQSLDERAIRSHSEADTRRVFLMPLFHALGWDVYSREEVAEEVKAASGRVDYVFKLHGVSQFYLEAKALRVDLTRPDYIKQAITYAYNKGITWAVLSDFEGLQVYNAQTGRLFINLSYENYLRDFDDLWLLSKEAFQNNALNEKAEKYGALPPRLGIEQRLYNQLRQWREELFNQLHLYNEELSVSQIDEVIQRLFNRLIFIRNCEDRGIEEKVLLSVVNEWRGSGRKGELIERLQSVFRDFDGYYDSDLFAYHLTDEVFIEGTTIEHIISGLYEIPSGMASYDFSIIDADVLGAVYEQYLGHVAAVVKQRAKEAQARMDLGLPTEETYEMVSKKQRRKEHGIYYTPKFVTNYIVKETVGRFLKERSHNEILNLKILDPACGSGSFLIRAYDELLGYHAYQRSKPVSELDQWERRAILLGNIFGVDLDMQAVEIACLNLLLRSLARRETLPSLADNIRQGDSLISGTEEELKSYFGDNWREKKPFNWEQEFKDIMANGGFDVVIGNPPYVQLSMEEKLPFGLKDFLLDKYKSSMGRLNTFGFFIKRGIELLRDGGYLGFIIPNTILTQDYYEELRRSILETCAIETIASFVDLPFRDAVVENAVLILEKNKSEKIRNSNKVAVYKVNEELSFELDKSITQEIFSQSHKCSFNIHIDESRTLLRKKLEESSWPLSKFVNTNQAIALKHERERWVSKTKIDESYKPLLVGGRNINRYLIAWDKHYLHYDRAGIHSGGDEEKFVVKEKIFFRRVADRLIGTLDTNQFYGLHTLVVMTLKEETPFDIRFILALFNSKLLNFYYRSVFASTKKVFSEIGARQVARLPVKSLNLSTLEDKKMHDALVALVDKMLELNKRLAPIRDTYCNERDELLREIKRTDAEIDQKVYQLYGLTEEERQVIEASLVSKS